MSFSETQQVMTGVCDRILDHENVSKSLTGSARTIYLGIYVTSLPFLFFVCFSPLLYLFWWRRASKNNVALPEFAFSAMLSASGIANMACKMLTKLQYSSEDAIFLLAYQLPVVCGVRFHLFKKINDHAKSPWVGLFLNAPFISFVLCVAKLVALLCGGVGSNKQLNTATKCLELIQACVSAYSLIAFYGTSLDIDGRIRLASLALVWWPIMQRHLILLSPVPSSLQSFLDGMCPQVLVQDVKLGAAGFLTFIEVSAFSIWLIVMLKRASKNQDETESALVTLDEGEESRMKQIDQEDEKVASL